MTAPARVAAYHALRGVSANHEELPAALARSREALPDERDRALAAEIVVGTLRWQRTLDHLIGHFAARPPDKLDIDIRIVLRLSLYQLLHLDRVPASAVVDDAVDLVRGARKRSATGFVNAVLRSMLRQRAALPLPPRPADIHDRPAALAYLGITHSHPDWLVTRWLDRHGFDAAERWVEFNNTTPAVTLRANRLRLSREALALALADEGVQTAPTAIAPDGLTVTAGRPLARENDGRYLVQEEASQLVPLVMGACPHERVLDLCASPGGKTTLLAAEMSDTGLLVACDVRPGRVSLLRSTVALSGARCVRIVRVPARGPLPFAGRFDRILVDAPCSGVGTVRRDPDIRWSRVESALPAFARDQLSLLTRAAAVLAPGGRLVYATCSSEPEENGDVVRAFLDRHPEFSALDLRATAGPPLRGVLDDRGRLHTLPFAHGTEAFFAAALVRRVGERIVGPP